MPLGQTKVVMAGPVPAIHAFLLGTKTWMPAPSAGMMGVGA
jgi:hypothetical protein